jgi:hypothetical protein
VPAGSTGKIVVSGDSVLNGREVPEPFDVEPFVARVVDVTLRKRTIGLSYHLRERPKVSVQ